MDYRILTANGDNEYNSTISDVSSVEIKDEAYVFYASDKRVIFSSPLESTVYVVKVK